MKIESYNTAPVQEQFRLIPSQFIQNETGEDLDNWKVTKYLLGDKLVKADFGLEVFDSISILDRTGDGIFLHGRGWRKSEGKWTTIILASTVHHCKSPFITIPFGQGRFIRKLVENKES